MVYAVGRKTPRNTVKSGRLLKTRPLFLFLRQNWPGGGTRIMFTGKRETSDPPAGDGIRSARTLPAREWTRKRYSTLWVIRTYPWRWTITPTRHSRPQKRKWNALRHSGKRLVYYFFTTFEGGNLRIFKNLREYLPIRKAPPKPVNTGYNGF